MIAISIPIPIITVGWVAASVLIGLLAMAKGRSFVSWSLAAALASPVVVLLLVVLPKAKQIKQPPAPPKIASPKPAALRTNAALPIKAIKALAYRVESSRIVGSLSRTKAAGYRSLENFAAAAEIDKGIAAAVRDEFPNDPIPQMPTERKSR